MKNDEGNFSGFCFFHNLLFMAEMVDNTRFRSIFFQNPAITLYSLLGCGFPGFVPFGVHASEVRIGTCDKSGLKTRVITSRILGAVEIDTPLIGDCDVPLKNTELSAVELKSIPR